MMRNRAFLAAAASVALTSSMAHATQTTEAACMTEAELEGVLLLVMPDTVRQLTKHCAPSLAAHGYLMTKGEALSMRFETAAEAIRPAALSGAAKLVGKDGADLPPEDMVKAIKGIVVPKVGQGLKAKDCHAIDRIFGYLDPLPARNLSGMIAVIVNVSAADQDTVSRKGTSPKKGSGPFLPICSVAGA